MKSVSSTSRQAEKQAPKTYGQLTGHQRDEGFVDGVSAESLNTHYALVSTDAHYTVPLTKLTVTQSEH